MRHILIALLLMVAIAPASAVDTGVSGGSFTYTFSEGQTTLLRYAIHTGAVLATYGNRVLTSSVTANGDEFDHLTVTETTYAADTGVLISITPGDAGSTSGISFTRVYAVVDNGDGTDTPYYSTQQIGYFEGGVGSDPLRVVLNDFAQFDSLAWRKSTTETVPAVTAVGMLLNALIYRNDDQDPAEQSKTITFSFDGQSAPAPTAVIQVDPVNDLPQITSSDTSVVVYENGSGSGIVAFTDLDQGDGEAFGVELSRNPAKGAVVFTANDEGFSWEYTANDDVGGSDLFIYSIRDFDGGLSTPISVSVTIADINDEPVFTAIGATGGVITVSMDEDSSLSQSVIASKAAAAVNPSHESSQTVSMTLVSNSNPGLFPGSSAVIDQEGVLTLDPAEGVAGTATLVFAVTDDGGTAFGGDDTGDKLTLEVTVAEDASDQASIDTDVIHVQAGLQADFTITVTPDGSSEVVSFQKLSDPGHGTVLLDRSTGSGTYYLPSFPSDATGSTFDDPMEVAVTTRSPDGTLRTVSRELIFRVTNPDSATTDRVIILSSPINELVGVSAPFRYVALASVGTLGEQVQLQWQVLGLGAAIDPQGTQAVIDLDIPAQVGVYRVEIRCWDTVSGTADVQTLYVSVVLDPSPSAQG